MFKIWCATEKLMFVLNLQRKKENNRKERTLRQSECLITHHSMSMSCHETVLCCFVLFFFLCEHFSVITAVISSSLVKSFCKRLCKVRNQPEIHLMHLTTINGSMADKSLYWHTANGNKTKQNRRKEMHLRCNSDEKRISVAIFSLIILMLIYKKNENKFSSSL